MDLLNLQADLTKYRNCTNKSFYFHLFQIVVWLSARIEKNILRERNVLVLKFAVKEYFEYLRNIITYTWPFYIYVYMNSEMPCCAIEFVIFFTGTEFNSSFFLCRFITSISKPLLLKCFLYVLCGCIANDQITMWQPKEKNISSRVRRFELIPFVTN